MGKLNSIEGNGDNQAGRMSERLRTRAVMCALLASCAVSALGTSAAFADDIIVDSHVFVTQTLDGDDTITITENGFIDPPAGAGVDASGSGNTIINRGRIETSSNGIRAEDHSTVVNSGFIDPRNVGASGINVRVNSVVRNSGTVISDDEFAYGIRGVDSSQIYNSGRIETSGLGESALNADDNSYAENSGTIDHRGVGGAMSALNQSELLNLGLITVYDIFNSGMILYDGSEGENRGTIQINSEDAYGVRLSGQSNTFLNSGLITSSVDHAIGIEAENSDEAINSGTIRLTGDQSTGILAFELFGSASTVVLNSGEIIVSGSDSGGIRSRNNNTITNSGAIRVLGANSGGVVLFGDDNVFTNSGLIVAVEPDAAAFGVAGLASGNIINLLAPSFLAGNMDLGSGTEVNITSGESHSILWDLSDGTMAGGAPNLSGPVPIFYDSTSQRVGTFDPSLLAGVGAVASDLNGLINLLVDGRLAGSGGSMTSGPGVLSYAQVSDLAGGNEASDQIADAFDPADTSNHVWASTFGSASLHRGGDGVLDQTFTQGGVAVGIDGELGTDTDLGALIAYSFGQLSSKSKFSDSMSTDVQSIVAAVYGEQRFDDAFVSFDLAGGLSMLDQTRTINDNLAPNGLAEAIANYNSWFISPTLKIGADFDHEGWVFTPSAQVSYLYQSTDGYTETGPSNGNATVDGFNSSALQARIELAAATPDSLGDTVLKAGWQYTHSLSAQQANVTMLNSTQSVGFGAQDGHAAYLGLNSTRALTDQLDLNISGEVLFGTTIAARGALTLQGEW